jgi:hypothetical protein
MRFLLAMVVALSVPFAAAAQSRAGTPDALPVLPPIGLPLPPIGLPLAPIGLPPVATPPATKAPGPGGRDHGDRGHGRHNGRSGSSIVYVVPAYDWLLPIGAQATVEAAVAAPEPAAAAPRIATGRLRLEIDADTPVQVTVDGYYAGTLDELRNELDVEAGVHRVELQAVDYEPLAVDVRISASRSITYRGAMVRTPPRGAASRREPAASADTPAPRSTIYFIPGCYLGNVHPADVALPAGCDLNRLVVRQP